MPAPPDISPQQFTALIQAATRRYHTLIGIQAVLVALCFLAITLEGPNPTGLRQVVQATRAAILVLASPNSPTSLRAAASLPGPKEANIVLTLDRNGTGFPRFFHALFGKMREGRDMMSAWVELAPQHPSANESWAPQTLLLAEGGKIVFGR